LEKEKPGDVQKKSKGGLLHLEGLFSRVGCTIHPAQKGKKMENEKGSFRRAYNELKSPKKRPHGAIKCLSVQKLLEGKSAAHKYTGGVRTTLWKQNRQKIPETKES